MEWRRGKEWKSGEEVQWRRGGVDERRRRGEEEESRSRCVDNPTLQLTTMSTAV